MRPLVLVALALALPAASATWSVSGSFEPDTREDVNGQRMYLEPDQSPNLMRVYFNAYPADRTGAGAADVNPNLGELRSRHLPPAALGMTAWLGVWKDCNKDGHVGHLETLAVAYRSELLLDDSICPPGSRHNRFSWVTEFLYISPDPQNLTASFPRVIWDPDAKVWGDFGRPQFEGERRFGCADPLPHAALESTGGMLGAIDCHMGHQVARFLADNEGFGLVPAFEGEGGFYHPENACGHPLNVHVGLHGGDPCAPDDPGIVGGGAEPIVSVWDCSDGGDGGNVRVPDPNDPFDNSKFWFYLGAPPPPGPSDVDPEGSAYVAADALLAQCDRPPSEDGLGEDLVAPSSAGTTPADPKRHADLLFEYDLPGGSVGTTPVSLGLRTGQGAWNTERTYAAPGYHANLVRTSDLEGNAAQYFTFYAFVGPRVVDGAPRLPLASPGVYAAEACGDETSGIHRGWDCDAAHWWNEDMGGVDTAGAPVPGDAYHLRDTDCYDGSVMEGIGVYASAYLLSDEDPCPALE